MKLYKTIWICGALCMVGLFSGCESNIDLEPKGILSEGGYFKSVADYEKALTGLYVRFNNDNYNFWVDGVTDDAMINHDWNWGYALAIGTATSEEKRVQERWERNYINVQRANNVVNNIDRYAWPGGEQDTDRKRILGEARGVRSYFYLELVSLFGRIMFYEKNPATVEESLAVTQVEDPKVVFDFIIEDLRKAIEELPEKAVNKSHFSKPGARLLRARAAAFAASYLNDKSYYQITLDETDELLKIAPALGDYSKLFELGNDNINEVLLVRSYSEDKKNGFGNWCNQSIGGYCVTVPLKALVDSYEYIDTRNDAMPYTNKDPRLYASIYVPGSVIRGKYYNTVPGNKIEKNGKYYFDPQKDYGSLQDLEVLTGDSKDEIVSQEWNQTSSGLSWKKYFNHEDTWNSWQSFVVLRYGEAYVLRAEAAAETGKDDIAKAALKVIRDRAGNTNDIDKALKDIYGGNLINMARNERRVEMACEGLRIYDIKRWKILLDVMNKPMEGLEYRDFSSGIPVKKVYKLRGRDEFTEKDYWFPIPQTELNLNEGRITQNPGWK